MTPKVVSEHIPYDGLETQESNSCRKNAPDPKIPGSQRQSFPQSSTNKHTETKYEAETVVYEPIKHKDHRGDGGGEDIDQLRDGDRLDERESETGDKSPPIQSQAAGRQIQVPARPLIMRDLAI